jgi:hypothetical protein
MLSGCCCVTTPYQDADSFINSGLLKNGKLVYDEKTNGFLTSMKTPKDPRVMDSPEYTADLIEHLIFKEPDVAIKIGQKGKDTARKLFNQKSFEKQWRKLLEQLKIL